MTWPIGVGPRKDDEGLGPALTTSTVGSIWENGGGNVRTWSRVRRGTHSAGQRTVQNRQAQML